MYIPSGIKSSKKKLNQSLKKFNMNHFGGGN